MNMRVFVTSHINFRPDPLNSEILFMQTRPAHISQMQSDTVLVCSNMCATGRSLSLQERISVLFYSWYPIVFQSKPFGRHYTYEGHLAEKRQKKRL